MGRRSPRSLTTPATAALEEAGYKFLVHTYTHDPKRTDFGMECVEALGVEPGRVFKTLVLQAGKRCVVAVVPVCTLVHVKSVGQHLGEKHVELAEARTAERRTGYVIGGVSPFGQRQAHRTLIDVSAAQWETVFVSGGRRGVDLEVTTETLITATQGELAEIAR